MKITIRVKPNARSEEVVAQPDGSFLVSVKAPPAEGRANSRLIDVLAAYFDRPKRNITILHGTTGRSKIVEIL
jgi:uncharacterized protein (TIGR00251 family)